MPHKRKFTLTALAISAGYAVWAMVAALLLGPTDCPWDGPNDSPWDSAVAGGVTVLTFEAYQSAPGSGQS